MSLLDRLRPQWRHSDPEVRVAAVRELGEEDQELLTSLAHEDPDPRVRRQAIKKIQDPLHLRDIADQESIESLKELAEARAAEISVGRACSSEGLDSCRAALSQLNGPKHIVRVAIGAHHPDIRKAALARLSEEKSLAEIVTKANDPSLREEALGRMIDASILQRIASNGTETEVALAALERIEDADILHAIAEERDAHKAVRQRARAKLELVITEDHPLREQARQQRQKELSAAAELLLESTAADPSLPEATEQFMKMEEEWNRLASKTAPDGDLRERFEQVGRVLAERVTRLQDRKLEEARRAAELERLLARRLELCEQVDSLQGEKAMERLERARSDWKSLPLPPPLDGAETTPARADDALDERFARAVERCEQRLQSWQAEQAFRVALQELLAVADREAESKLADALRSWPKLEQRWLEMERVLEAGAHAELAGPARERFAKAQERLHARQKESKEKQERARQESLARLKELCGRLDELVQAKELNLKAADHELRLAAAKLMKLGPLPSSENPKEWRARLSSARRLLFQRFQEQRETEEWKRWANIDLQEKLIHQAESLREVSDLAQVAKELRHIQEEWKRVGSAPRGKSEALWKRFSKVRDELRQRCEVYFAENLQKKLALCERVEQLADSTDWNKTAKAIQRIQAEWKDIGPVPLKQTKPIWRRFRKPCDAFFQKRNEFLDELKETRHENAKKKAELCRQAEALAESTDWEQTAHELKRLQTEWKATGPAPHKKSEALWNRFRKACDHFFDRRKRRGEIEFEGKLRQKEAVCMELESLVASLRGSDPPTAEAVSREVQEAWGQWSGVGPVPADKETLLRKRLEEACSEIVSVFPEGLSGTPLDPRGNHKRRENFCTQL
jgi:hypothetical protein